MALTIEVVNAQQHARLEHAGGPLEFGRGPQRNCTRVLIEDLYVSRDQFRLEELSDGRLRLENLSSGNALELGGGRSLAPGQSGEQTLPLQIAVGKTRISVTRVVATKAIPGDRTMRMDATAIVAPVIPPGLTTIDLPERNVRRQRPTLDLFDPAHSAALEGLTQWLEAVIELQQAPAGSSEFFDRATQTMLDLLSLDLGLVLVRQDGNWKIVGSTVADDRVGVRYSRTLLDHVASQQRTFYQDIDKFSSSTASLADIESAVVSPVFGLHGDVIGALYGARLQQNLIDRGGITPVEAQLVQLLAAAVGANMARSLAARTRVQFEQFFSSELVRELERDPQLLEGRVEQVTILFSDLRGFTILSQRLGAEKTCRMVRDMMERLSERIVEHGGVIVDYAGDGILAMWNAPARQDDHAERACRAALAMLGELPALNARWAPETEGAPLALGIGINTGEAQVGNTGSTRKFKYGPHGHTVNLASRVQDATKHLGLPLLVSDSTRAQLGGGFVQRRLGQVRLPGVKEPVMLHEVLDASADSGWLALRESYERALGFYETAQWARTCEALMPLVAASPPSGPFDVPTLKLMRRAWECLESRPETFEPVLEVTAK